MSATSKNPKQKFSGKKFLYLEKMWGISEMFPKFIFKGRMEGFNFKFSKNNTSILKDRNNDCDCYKITEYFPVRRSKRRTAKEIEVFNKFHFYSNLSY